MRVSLAFLSFLFWSTRGATVQLDAAGLPVEARCLQLDTDAATLACLQQQPPETATHIRALLEACMQRGQWKASAHLVALSKKKALDVANTVSTVSSHIRRELQTLSDSISSPVTEGIAPAYECVPCCRTQPTYQAGLLAQVLPRRGASHTTHYYSPALPHPLLPRTRWAQSWS